MASTTPRTPDYEYSPVPLPPGTTQQGKGSNQPKHVYVGTSSVTPSLTEKPGGLSTERRGWTSTYLQNTTLLGFAITFICLLLAVIALAVLDAKQNGIANAKSSEHYLWTYGPTAVLVVVAALWNQVEYRTKHAMPWVLLQKGATPASKALLMDYITPGKPEALLASLRKSHWPVAIAITNSFLITLLTVASTGLLVLQDTPFTQHNCRLNVTDDLLSEFDPLAIGSAPILATLAIQNGTIPFPPGTSRNMAFQTLLPPTSFTGVSDVELEGIVKAFSAELECEVATITSGASGCDGRQCHGLNVTLGITTPTCEIKNYNLTTGCGMQLDAVSCDVDATWGVGCDTYAEGHGKNRLVFMFGQLNQDLGSASKMNTTMEILEVVAGNTTTVVCQSKYNITDTYVFVDRNGNVKDTPHGLNTTNRNQQFPSWSLVDGLLTAADASGLVLSSSWTYSSWSSNPWSPFHELFTTWVRIAHPSSDLKDPSVLQSRASEMFSMATAQMAKQSLMRVSSDVTIGTCHGIEDRLRVRGLSLYLMVAVLVLLVLSTVSLLCIAPRNYSSRDPSSIGGLALVLSQSAALLSRLSNLGFADLKTIKSELSLADCQTTLTQDSEDWRLTVDLTPSRAAKGPASVFETTDPPTNTYWQPLSIRPVFKSLVIAGLLVLVIVLEVLYSVSQKRSGLAEVDPQRYQRFVWVYVPAIVMLIAQTLVGMIVFSSLMMFPYFRLRKASSNTCSDILRNYASETAIKCLWQSIAAKHIVVTCMAFAMLLTPLLTIAVSGLYTAQATSVQLPVTFSVQGQLNSSFSPGDIPTVMNHAYMVSANNIGLLLTQNFTFPLWTHDELAFPEAVLDLPQAIPSNATMLLRSNVSVALPAIRSDLLCSIVDSIPTNFSDILGGFAYRKANVSAFEALGVYDQHSNLAWPNPGMEAFGFFTACVYEYRGAVNTFCGAFGTSQVNWNAFTCTSVINELDVEVTMDASTLSILATQPMEDTSRLFSNQSLVPGGLDDFPSSMVPSLFGTANFGSNAYRKAAGFYDPMFQAVVYGLGTHDSLDNFPMADYMNDDGFNQIANQLQHIHRTIVAQSSNLIRIPLNTTSPLAPPATINATLTNPHVYRLRQSVVSTRILDGLLVAIALCIALSFGLMDTRKVLPKNPASIAGAASLIAGESQMLSKEVLPEGAQWYSDAELNAKKVWDGLFFRLGWWDRDGPSEEEGQGKYFKLDSM